MTDDSARAYRQATAFGASPVGQVVALYDALLRDLHKATTAIAAGHVESRVAAANHALTIIGELQGVLDFEHGGEPARTLEAFYQVTRTMILHGSMNCSRETLLEVVAMFTRLRSAWSQIERKVEISVAAERMQSSSSPSQMSYPAHDSAPVEESDIPKQAGWRA